MLFRSGGLRARTDVDLGDLVTVAGAGVLQRERDGQLAVTLPNREVAVGEGGVRQAVAEGEQRGGLLLVVPAVAHVDALGIVLLIVHSRVPERVAGDPL